MSGANVAICTSLALLAFAGNSVLCRLALHGSVIDPASFTALRLASGAVFLFILASPKACVKALTASGFTQYRSAIALFVYASCFSYAYVDLDTGAGALVLFGAVQLTMLLMAILTGGTPKLIDLVGMFLALLGLAWLMLPAAHAPSLSGFVIMTIAGIAWALYTYFGRNGGQPLINTAVNFVYSIPLILVLIFFNLDNVTITGRGVLLACVSGALTSGLGYALWYLALNYLSIIQAAVLQLLVPILAAIGGVLFVSEGLSLQLIVSSLLVLGGVGLTLLSKRGNTSR